MAKLIGLFHQKGSLAAQKNDETNLAGRNIPEIREKDIVRKYFFERHVIDNPDCVPDRTWRFY